MTLTRRSSLKLGVAAFSAATLPAFAFAQQDNSQPETQQAFTHEVEGGSVAIYPIDHASMVIQTPDQVIYVDPVGGAEKYAALPAPGLILITHEHGDHYDVATLEGIGTEAPIVANPAVHEMLPEALKARATAMANGETGSQGNIEIEAIPAYNTTEDRQQYHPQGRDNGYILTIGGKRFYIAGDTEPTPEMLALTDIEVAFLPMNLPYTETIEQAAEAVATFQPRVVYPYHHKGSDIQAFKRLVDEGSSGAEVVIANWYPAGEA